MWHPPLLWHRFPTGADDGAKKYFGKCSQPLTASDPGTLLVIEPHLEKKRFCGISRDCPGLGGIFAAAVG